MATQTIGCVTFSNVNAEWFVSDKWRLDRQEGCIRYFSAMAGKAEKTNLLGAPVNHAGNYQTMHIMWKGPRKPDAIVMESMC